MQPHKRPSISNPDAKTHLLIVMGVSGSGKSTLAKALADHYGYVYLDGDNFHSQEARDRMAQGLPLTDEMRLPWVMRMRDYFCAAAANTQNSTLAFSGLKRAHRDELRKTGLKTLFLFLHGDQTTIQQRVDNRSGHFMDPCLVASQFDNLEQPGSEECDIVKIDVRVPFAQVLQQALDIIDHSVFEAA